MLGFSFKDRVKKIIKEEFDYELSAGTASVLPDICSQAKQTGANEHSAAIMIMLVAMDSLGIEDDPEWKHRITEFILAKSKIILAVAHLANQPEDDIKQMLAGILEKHSIEIESDADILEKQNLEAEPKTVSQDLTELMITFGNSFIEGVFIFTDTYVGDDAREIFSEDQRKFIFFLQLWGALDCIMRVQGSSDSSKFFSALLALTCDNDFFDWHQKKLVAAMNFATESQDKEWARSIIINGGKATENLLQNNNDNITSEIWTDKEMLKKLALVVPKTF